MNKHPGGRPPKYKKEYCDMLVSHMAEGLSFESFAGILSTTKETLYNWVEKYPEFLYSKRVGTQKCRIYYEKAGIQGMTAKIPFFNDRIWRLQMINRFRDEWIDSTKTENKNENNTTIKGDMTITLNLNEDNVQPTASNQLPKEDS